MQPSPSSRVRLALLVAGFLLLGVALGGTAAHVWTTEGPPDAASVSTTPTPTAHPGAALPPADAPGEDFAQLPRYPGSVRSAYTLDRDAQFRLVAAEYLVLATIDEVRSFYQGVIVDHGWERADIGFQRGEWTYVLVHGVTEALVEIEEVDGLIEIDLQVSEPVAAPTPAVTPPPATPAPTARPPAPSPIDDDDGGGDDDDGSGGGAESDDDD